MADSDSDSEHYDVDDSDLDSIDERMKEEIRFYTFIEVKKSNFFINFGKYIWTVIKLNPNCTAFDHVWEFFPNIFLNDLLDIVLNGIFLIKPIYKTLFSYRKEIFDFVIISVVWMVTAPLVLSLNIISFFYDYSNLICNFIISQLKELKILQFLYATFWPRIMHLSPIWYKFNSFFWSIWLNFFYIDDNFLTDKLSQLISPLRLILSFTSSSITEEEAIKIHTYLGWLHTASNSIAVVCATNAMTGKFSS